MRVSYVGMISQDVSIKPGVIKVVLKSDSKALDEVVVTAMGISREKKALGYAVQDVKSDQLTQAANSNLAGALQGKVSGLDVKPSSGMPGASSQITIRGARSFSGEIPMAVTTTSSSAFASLFKTTFITPKRYLFIILHLQKG